MHTIGVCLVTTHLDGRVLLIRTTSAGWELRGGRVEPGEDLLEAARREALEESGCSVEVGRLTGLYFGVDAAMLLVVFRATSSTADPHPTPAMTTPLSLAGSLPRPRFRWSRMSANTSAWPMLWPIDPKLPTAHFDAQIAPALDRPELPYHISQSGAATGRRIGTGARLLSVYRAAPPLVSIRPSARGGAASPRNKWLALSEGRISGDRGRGWGRPE